MYNKMFSILTRGRGVLRKVSKSYKEDPEVKAIHEALVPANGSSPFVDLAAEQLIQCVRSSSMRRAAVDFDPESRYEYPLPFPVLFEHTLTGLTDNIVVSYRKTDAQPAVMNVDCVLTVNADTNTVRFIRGDRQGETEHYDYSQGLSSDIILNDNVVLNIKNLDSGSHHVELSYELPFTRSLLEVEEALPLSSPIRYEFAKQDQLPDRMAVIVMDVCLRQEK